MTAFSFPLSQCGIYICSASKLKLKFNRAQTQSQQTNKFPFFQVEVSAFSQVKKGTLFSPPKLPYLWRAVHLKLSWLWNIGVFIGMSMCGECTHLKQIYVSTCVCFCILFLRWLTMSDTMMCNLLCWWEGRGSRIRGWLTSFGLYKYLINSPLFFPCYFPDFFIISIR